MCPTPLLARSADCCCGPKHTNQAWFKENAVPISTVEWDATDNFSDLRAAFDTIVKDKDIVLLGENYHSDGTCHKWKWRMFRYLYSVHGFDVGIHESPIYAMHVAQTNIANGTDAKSALPNGLLNAWSWTNELIPFADWVSSTQNTSRPFISAGLDHMANPRFEQQYPTDLTNFLTNYPSLRTFSNDPYFGTFVNTTQGVRLLALGFTSSPPSLVEQTTFLAFGDQIERAIIALPEFSTNVMVQFWFRCVVSHNQWARQVWSNPENFSDLVGLTIRGVSQGENFRFLKEVMYPNHKIVVQMANTHIMSNPIEVIPPYAGGYTSLGHYVKLVYGNKAYSIGSTAYSGSPNWKCAQGIVNISPPPSQSIEAYLKAVGYPYAFVDFQKASSNGGNFLFLPELVGRPIWAYDNFIGPWAKCYDGLFFTAVQNTTTIRPDAPGFLCSCPDTVYSPPVPTPSPFPVIGGSSFASTWKLPVAILVPVIVMLIIVIVSVLCRSHPRGEPVYHSMQ